MSRRGVLLGVLAICAALTRTAAAHPLGTTEIALDLRDPARIEVRLNANAEGLIARLVALAPATTTPARTMPAGDDAARITALASTLLAQLGLEQDGVRVPLALASVETPEPQRVLVRLTAPGVAAPGAALRWRTALVYGSYPLTVWHPSRLEPAVEWVSGGDWSAATAAGTASDWASRTWHAAVLGFTHIVPAGVDHVLFVLGLFLLTSRLRPVLAQVTAFTLAHSITLALTLYGVVSAPASVVEPLIALSIAYVAVENLLTSTLTRWRLALVFSFGLLHGLGFAEALARLELPRGALLGTLAAFNVGVEAGQLAVLGAAAAAVAALRMTPVTHRRWIVRPVSAAIGLAGVFWTIERVWV